MKQDERHMRQALAQAKRARDRGEVPVGAIIASRGKVLGRGYNRPISQSDPTAHAEVVAIRQAGRMRGNYRLADCDLYVTLEPCVMCLGAAVQARIRRVVFGAWDSKSGAVRSIMRFPLSKMNHRPELKGGLLAEECSRVLKDFFVAQRVKQGKKPAVRRARGEKAAPSFPGP
jgi:tRNA(adenine34) deaminase